MTNDKEYNVYLTKQDIEQDKYYYTGIMISKIKDYLPAGEKLDVQLFLSKIEKNIDSFGNGAFVWSKCDKFLTKKDYAGYISEIRFVNFKGEMETELVGIFFKSGTLVYMLCETPTAEFANYKDLFKEIIDNAQLF